MLAVTEAPVPEDKFVVGDQEYVLPPDAVNVIGSFVPMVADAGEIVIVGSGFTVAVPVEIFLLAASEAELAVTLPPTPLVAFDFNLT